MLGRGIRLGTVGGHVHAASTAVERRVQLPHGAETRNQQHGDLGLPHLRGYRADVLFVAVRSKTVLQRVATQATTMGDLDVRNTGIIERGSNLDHLFDTDLLALGVHAVTQAHVMQDYFAALEARTGGLAHYATSGALS
ncbi:hypothetical protein D3C78_1590680 [compost metagenome]